MELKNLSEIMQVENDTPTNRFNCIKRLDYYSNACFTYRIIFFLKQPIE